MSEISKQFEFHLKGASAPEGELEADHLLAIVTSLKEVATKVGRAQTDAEAVGRPPARVQRVAKLLIGLVPGSTTLLARRVGAGDGALDFDLPDEEAFDERFEALVESIADDRRPSWVTDSLSLAAEALAASLQQAAPEVEFRVGGQPRRSFRTVDVHRETWQVVTTPDTDVVTFVGRLYAANLHTHRLHVQDDVGNRVALPEVLDDTAAGRLLGNYVTVVGSPTRNSEGRLTEIIRATIEAAPDPLDGGGVPNSVSIGDILASGPGPDPDGGLHLTDEEAEAFFAAMGLQMPADHIVVVDTDIFSPLYITPEFADKRGLPVAAWRSALAGARVVISFQTKAEVLAGIHGSSWGASRTMSAVTELDRFPTIPADRSVIDAFATLSAVCRRAGHALHDKIHAADRWVAASAVAKQLPLMARDGIYVGAPGLTLWEGETHV